MGRLDAITPPQSSDQQPPSPPPQGYPNHHDNPLSSPPPPSPPAGEDYDQNMNHHPPPSTRSFIPQSHDQSTTTPPPPEAYPPQKPATYPPPAAYPPSQPEAVQFPPPQQQHPVQFPPPQQPQPVQFPPPQQPQPVLFPPPQQTSNANYNTSTPPQNYNYVYANNAGGGYQTPVKPGPPAGIAIGTQYLAPTQGWSTGLFDCAEDYENAIITACFPCITFGQIAEIVDNGQTSCATSGLIYGVISAFIGVPCIMSCGYRTKIRNRYGLMEAPAPDWATHCFCEWCALCQEYRELKHQGFDPSIGWQGNMAKNQVQMQQYPTMTPPNNQTMM